MVMGIPVSIDIIGATNQSDFEPAFDRLQAIDSQFSTYKLGSELSRYQRGVIKLADISSDLRAIQSACAEFADLTDGYFSAYYDGTFDPTGYVKGWAIEQASQAIAAQGFGTYLINAGGDIFGASDGLRRWNIGLQHPARRQSILGTVHITTGAVATSGTYERGAHILDPHTRLPATELVAVTVTGPSIVMSDVFATACLAMGRIRGRAFIDKQIGYAVLFVDHAGTVELGTGFEIAR